MRQALVGDRIAGQMHCAKFRECFDRLQRFVRDARAGNAELSSRSSRQVSQRHHPLCSFPEITLDNRCARRAAFPRNMSGEAALLHTAEEKADHLEQLEWLGLRNNNITDAGLNISAR